MKKVFSVQKGVFIIQAQKCPSLLQVYVCLIASNSLDNC